MSKISTLARSCWISPARMMRVRKDLPVPVAPKMPEERWTNFLRSRQTGKPCSRVWPMMKLPFFDGSPKMVATSPASARRTRA
jgi:hypothetical protein